MVGIHATWFIAMLCEYYLGSSSIPEIVSWVALTVFVGAQVLRLWTLRVLGSQWNVQVMAPSSGGNTPRLVTVGPYRYVRHPNYLAVILEFVALPLVGNVPITATVWSCLNGLVLYFRIRREEHYLKGRPEFEECLSKVPCLVPRLWVL
jgi:methyltransferase